MTEHPTINSYAINEIQVFGGGPRDRRDIIIQRRRQRDGSSLWSINERGNCLSIDGVWVLEPIPSSRDDAYTARMRWPTMEAAIAGWARFQTQALED